MSHFFVGNVDETHTTFVKSHDSSSVNHDVIDDESELPWAMYRSLDPVLRMRMNKLKSGMSMMTWRIMVNKLHS